jgi:hypothetical protein
MFVDGKYSDMHLQLQIVIHTPVWEKISDVDEKHQQEGGAAEMVGWRQEGEPSHGATRNQLKHVYSFFSCTNTL